MVARLKVSSLSISVSDHERSFTLGVQKLELGFGEVMGLTGPSGTGKTMLLEVLGLIRRPSNGTYTLNLEHDSLDLVHLWNSDSQQLSDVRAKYFGFVPQSGGLLPFLTVDENIALSQRIAGRNNQDWRYELIQKLDLTSTRSLTPDALSIGQRQRVAIARALAHSPAFIIADEPTSALDPGSAETAMALLIEAAAMGGAGVIISSHDLALLNQFPMRRFALTISNPSPAKATAVCATLGEFVGAG